MPEAKTALARTGRLIRTVRYLKARQITDRVLRHLPQKPPASVSAPTLRAPARNWSACEGRARTMLSPTRFRFLAIEADIAEPQDWNNPQLPKLWLYTLHYFDDLLAAGAEERRAWHKALIERWIAENPPVAGNGWEPYPLSRRIVNWICWALSGNGLPDQVAASLALQARALTRLLEFHLMGNHLFANAKALVFAGAYFAGAEADRWLSQGLQLVGREIEEQILSDGGHFELSPMYHAVMLEDMIDLVQLAGTFPEALRDASERQQWRRQSEKMLGWLARMRHPDGEIALFNDSAFGQARRPDELFAYAGLFGSEVPEPRAGAAGPGESGYVRLQKGPWCALFDAAEVGARYIPGHAHADTLSFELSIDGTRIITNGGTSTYAPGALRERERATASHSTVEIDGENSSEVWGSFRVGRRARVFNVAVGEDNDTITAAASHDGYRFLRGRPQHRRIISVEADRVTVRDMLSGDGRHAAVARFLLHPDVADVRATERGWKLLARNGALLEVEVEGPVALELEEGSFAPAFGVTHSSQVITWRYGDNLPVMATTIFKRTA